MRYILREPAALTAAALSEELSGIFRTSYGTAASGLQRPDEFVRLGDSGAHRLSLFFLRIAGRRGESSPIALGQASVIRGFDLRGAGALRDPQY